MKGECPNCKEVVKITARTPLIPYKSNPRAMDYYPEAHKLKDKNNQIILDKDGKPIWCGGDKKAII